MKTDNAPAPGGFSAANLVSAERVDPGRRRGVAARGGKLLAALLVLAALTVEVVLAVGVLPSPILVGAALAFGLPLTALIFKRPELGLYLVIGFIPLESIASRHNEPLSLFKVVGGLTIAAFVVGWALQGRYRLKTSGVQSRILLVFIAVLIFSSCFSIAPDSTLNALRRYATMFLFYFLIVNLVQRSRAVRTINALVIIPTCISASIAVVSYFLGQNLFPAAAVGNNELMRVVGTGRDANIFACTILVGLPFCFYYLLHGTNRLLRAFSAFSFVMIILAVAYSFSRGGSIGMGVMLLAMAWGERKRLSPRALACSIAGLVVVALILLALIPGAYLERVAALGSADTWEKDGSLARRSLYVKLGSRVLADHLITGVGPGAFPDAMDAPDIKIRFPEWLRSEGDKSLRRGRGAHNTYLEVATELGIPGAIVFGILIIYTLWEISRVRLRFERDGPRELWLAARSLEVSFWGYLVTSTFLSNELHKYTWFFLGMTVVLAGFARIHENIASPRKSAVPPRRSGGTRLLGDE